MGDTILFVTWKKHLLENTLPSFLFLNRTGVVQYSREMRGGEIGGVWKFWPFKKKVWLYSIL